MSCNSVSSSGNVDVLLDNIVWYSFLVYCCSPRKKTWLFLRWFPADYVKFDSYLMFVRRGPCLQIKLRRVLFPHSSIGRNRIKPPCFFGAIQTLFSLFQRLIGAAIMLILSGLPHLFGNVHFNPLHLYWVSLWTRPEHFNQAYAFNHKMAE